MSFILDSLRKSDRNREQSEIPGLHTVHEVPVRKSAPKMRLLLPYLLIGALLLNGGAMIWWLGSGHEGDKTGEVATMVPSLQPANLSSFSHTLPMPVAKPNSEPVPVTRVPVTRVPVTRVPVTRVPVTKVPVTKVPVTKVPVTKVPVTKVPVTKVPVTKVPEVKKALEVVPVTGVAKKTKAKAENRPSVSRRTEDALIGPRGAEKQAASSRGNGAVLPEAVAVVAEIKPDAEEKVSGPPVAEPGSTGRRIYELWELPASVRQVLPKMSFPGFAYTSNPSSRMAIINGRILKEGDSFGTDLRLEEVVPKGAILSFRGYFLRISSQPGE